MRVALVLSGAVALGSFEAGVVHELLDAVARGAPLTVDLVAGASAGALVGTVATRSLVAGAPYGPALRSWTTITLQRLTATYERPDQARRRGKPLDQGLLSSEFLRRLAREFTTKSAAGAPYRPTHPAPRLALLMTMTNLDGLPGTGAPGDEHRYGEAVTFLFARPGAAMAHESRVWQRVSQVALASAALPGAFDPVPVNWQARLDLPGEVVEHWENTAVLERLQQRLPGLQARMRYADGGILDNQPIERAISALPWVTGKPGEAGYESLVFDPRRILLFVEPDPPVTALKELSNQTGMGLFTSLGRALRLLDIASSPNIGRRRVLLTNQRILYLLEFLAVLGQRIRDGFRPARLVDLEKDLRRAWREAPGGMADSPPASPLAEEPGTIPAGPFARGVRAFYAWLADPERSEADLTYLERIGARKLGAHQAPARRAVRVLREAYLGLAGLEPADPTRYQLLLEDAHLTLALRLGLNRPWVLLEHVAPEDPALLLRGEELVHFGGFLSRAFLRYDYEVGRYYAQQWLAGALPDWSPVRPAPPPVPSSEGISWRLFVANLSPVARIAGRFFTALGWSEAGPLQRSLASALVATLVVSAASSALWVLAWPVRWLTGRPDLVEAQAMLAAGGALFPLTLGGLLMFVLPRDLYRALLAAWLPRRRPRRRP